MLTARWPLFRRGGAGVAAAALLPAAGGEVDAVSLTNFEMAGRPGGLDSRGARLHG